MEAVENPLHSWLKPDFTLVHPEHFDRPAVTAEMKGPENTASRVNPPAC
jgi:hypothetical protein